MRRKNLLYNLRKKGVKVNTRERCIYLPYDSEPDHIAQVRRLRREYDFVIQFEICDYGKSESVHQRGDSPL